MHDHIYTDLAAIADRIDTLANGKALPPLAVFVDGQGLRCPMPLLKAKLALRQMADGDCLYLVASDENAGTDLGYFCQKNHHRLIHWQSDNPPLFHCLIYKNA